MEADELREKGNQHYHDGEFRQALQMYTCVCARYKKAYEFAEKSVHLDPGIAKVHYYVRGTA